jgi:diguanylate cyclase
MAKETDQSRTADHWKRKFYTSLDELEQKEKEWSEIERLLKTLASRLSLAADGQDARLDKQLEQLREALRNEKNTLKLTKIIHEVSRQVSRLDTSKTAVKDSVDLTLPLSKLLDRINIPDSLERQEKFVRKKLAKSYDLISVDDVVKDIAELFGLVMDVLSDLKNKDSDVDDTQLNKSETIEPDIHASTDKQQKSKEEKSGLFSGLFGRAESATEQAQQDLKESKTLSPVELSPEERVEHKTSQQMTSQQSPDVEADESSRLSLAADTLIRLLEQLQLPDDLHVQADLIKRKLETCNHASLLASGLESTADLLAELSQRVQGERKALEDFLLQLTTRLHELDFEIRETVKLRDQSHDAGQKINRVVSDEVNLIEKSVDAAVDLETLKTAIQSRVILIRDHMDHFLQGEEGRFSHSEHIINKLNNELALAKEETDTMRQQVVEAQLAAMQDQLTGIPNRMSYEKSIAAELARFNRYQTPFTMMVWDVDKFKNINDTYGHAAGDKVLIIIAKLLEQNIRETDHLARYGGEEFVIILSETTLQESPPLAEKLRKAVENIEFHFRGKRVVITASCGLAQVKPGEDSVAVFTRADTALYKAKESGRNRFEMAED